VAPVHPIERLRFVARAGGAPPSSLVREAAGALAGLAEDQAALVTACRRLIDGDPTGGVLAANLPDGAAVVILGWPELVGSAIRHRADLGVLLVDTLGEGSALARRLRSSGGDVVEVPEAGLGAAVGSAALVLVEALAMGEDGAVAVAGSWAAAAVARSAGVPTWLVAGVGRVLPVRLWEAVSRRLDEDADEPWDRAFDVVPLDLVDRVVGPAGVEDPGRALGRADCPIVPELLRPMVG
jgi:hypothetical protein